MQTLPRGALMRILFCLQIITIAFFSAFHPQSVVHEIASTQGEMVWAVLLWMCGLSVAGLIDVVINDCLPERYRFSWGLQFRHGVFMLLAIGYAMLMTFVVNAGLYAAVPYFLVNVVFIVMAAFSDVQRRFKHPQTRRKTDQDGAHA